MSRLRIFRNLHASNSIFAAIQRIFFSIKFTSILAWAFPEFISRSKIDMRRTCQIIKIGTELAAHTLFPRAC